MLKKDFGRGRVGKFSGFAKAKRREPISVHLTNQSVIWDWQSVALAGYCWEGGQGVIQGGRQSSQLDFLKK